MAAPAARLTLRTRAAVAVGVLGVFVVGASLAYNVRRTADSELADRLALDVALLANLPPLQAALRNADHQAMRYLLTGNKAWRDAHAEAAEAARAELADLARVAGAVPAFRGTVAGVRDSVEAALAEQESMVAEFGRGTMGHGRAVETASGARATHVAVRRIATLRELNYEGIRAAVDEAHRASQVVFLTILVTGAAATALLMYVLTAYIIRPIEALDAWARGWTPERPLGAPPVEAGAEVEGLCRSLSEMARRAADQVRQEGDVARMKTQLVSTLSHEFNNSLSVVQGMAALLEETEGAAPPEQRAKYYHSMKANLRSISHEMETLIEMGRLEGGRFAVRPRRIEVRDVLRASVERLRVLAERRRQTVTMEVPEVPIPVSGDPEALSMVATNLLSNAIKYTPDEGRITVRVEATESGVSVSVSDTGIGISPEDRERVFGGYYRTKAGQAKAKGFGVGLALARSIVEAHGSRLELESAPGKGSTFRFELPRWEEGGHGQG